MTGLPGGSPSSQLGPRLFITCIKNTTSYYMPVWQLCKFKPEKLLLYYFKRNKTFTKLERYNFIIILFVNNEKEQKKESKQEVITIEL